MAVNIKKKRVSRQYYAFFLACFASLLGLLVYILGARKITFPHQGMPGINGSDAASTKLFLFGISIHLQVNFFLGMIFNLLSTEKMDQVKLRKGKFGISRGMIFAASLIFGLMKYGENVKSSGGSILLLCLIITVINCCLIELLVQLMNQYGICNAFNLILFTEFIPYDGIAKNGNKPLPMLLLSLITIFFIGITNLKGEAPVETNTLHSQDSKILKKNKSKLGFRLSFGFMPFIQLSGFISWIYNIVLMRNAAVNGGNFKSIKDGGGHAEKKRAEETKMSEKDWNKTSLNQGFGPSFFVLSEARYIFDGDKLKFGFGEHKGKIIGALFFLIFLRGLMVGIQMRKVAQGRTGEMSKDLRSRGIYINYLSPGRSTRNLLKKVINKIIFFWYFIILVFNIIFDNIFKGFDPFLSFFSGFGGVNIGVDLVRQIRTKYKYIKTNR